MSTLFGHLYPGASLFEISDRAHTWHALQTSKKIQRAFALVACTTRSFSTFLRKTRACHLLQRSSHFVFFQCRCRCELSLGIPVCVCVRVMYQNSRPCCQHAVIRPNAWWRHPDPRSPHTVTCLCLPASVPVCGLFGGQGVYHQSDGRLKLWSLCDSPGCGISMSSRPGGMLGMEAGVFPCHEMLLCGCTDAFPRPVLFVLQYFGPPACLPCFFLHLCPDS